MQSAPAHDDILLPLVKSASATQEVTMYDIISFILFIVFSAVAVFFGWKYGTMYALKYWLVIQKFGEYLGTSIRGAISSVRTQRAVYTAAQMRR